MSPFKLRARKEAETRAVPTLHLGTGLTKENPFSLAASIIPCLTRENKRKLLITVDEVLERCINTGDLGDTLGC